MIVRAIGNPSPVPWGLVVTNASKMCVKSSWRMPVPESDTLTSATSRSASRRVRMVKLCGLGSYLQRLGRKYGAQRNLPPDHLRRNNFDQLRNRVIQIERLQIGRFSLVQQTPQAKNDVAGALLVPDDVGKDVADLDEIGRTGLEQHLCSFGIAQNSPQWLVELVSDR